VGRGAAAAGAVSRTVVRGVLLLALLLSLAVRFQSHRARETAMTEFDASAAIVRMLQARGFELRENPVKPPKLLSVVVYFQRPGCSRGSLVLPYPINAEAEPMLARVTEPGFDRRFYYLDSSWPEQHRVSMFLDWLKYATLDLVGASPFVPVKTAIVLADPPDCHPAEVIDWRELWEKDSQPDAVNAGGPTMSKAARS
jgi:hypothetical protein